MKRQNIVAGNWKMNKNFQEGTMLAQEVVANVQPSETQVILGTPFIHLQAVAAVTNGTSNIAVAAQNCHQAASGAYTGETSVGMIKSTGARYVILGHSERRAYYGETDALIAEKVKAVLAGGLQPIYCCGEKLEVREAGNQNELVGSQIREGLFHLDAAAFEKVVIAYEPVWAIGTGVTASPAQAQEMHKHIRSLIADQYGAEIADGTTILYGGSVKPNNAKELFSNPDVDGGLIGGASLKAPDFVAIINSI